MKKIKVAHEAPIYTHTSACVLTGMAARKVEGASVLDFKSQVTYITPNMARGNKI